MGGSPHFLLQSQSHFFAMGLASANRVPNYDHGLATVTAGIISGERGVCQRIVATTPPQRPGAPLKELNLR
jgi:hypothetical protein